MQSIIIALTALQHSNAVGRVSTLQPKSPWFDPELGLLFMWSNVLFSQCHQGHSCSSQFTPTSTKIYLGGYKLPLMCVSVSWIGI